MSAYTDAKERNDNSERIWESAMRKIGEDHLAKADPMTQPHYIDRDLLPCPFCGNEARTSTYETESLWSHNQVTYTKVFCDECDVSFATEPGYELEAPAAWNRRAPVPMEAVAWREKNDDT